MPTGYTSFIEEGKVRTAKQFLHLCLRNFGVCIHMRDESLELKDDYTNDIIKGFQHEIDYHQKQLEAAEKRLTEIKKMSDADLCKKYIKETKERIKYLQKARQKEFGEYGDYLMIREGIEKWKCSEQFQNIKDFALNQIDISIPNSSYYDEQLKTCGDPTEKGFQEKKDEYRTSLIEDAEWEINYHTEQRDNAIKRRTENLKFYTEFKEELEKLK